MGVLAFTRKQKAKCVTWYIETQSTTTVRKRFETKYGETTPFRSSILRLLENFDSYGNMEHRTGRGRSPMTDQTINSDRYYFKRHAIRFLRRLEGDLSVGFSTVRKILLTLMYMIPWKIMRVRLLDPV